MINITFPFPVTKPKLADYDLVDGHAYIVTNGAHDVKDTQIFICNKYHQVSLFSLDGKAIISKDAEGYEFEEVDLEIQVKRK